MFMSVQSMIIMSTINNYQIYTVNDHYVYTSLLLTFSYWLISGFQAWKGVQYLMSKAILWACLHDHCDNEVVLLKYRYFCINFQKTFLFIMLSPKLFH